MGTAGGGSANTIRLLALGAMLSGFALQGQVDGRLAAPLVPADLAVEQCTESPANPRTETYVVKPATLAAFLRLAGTPPPHTSWRTGLGPEPVKHIRVAFLKPIPIGTIWAVTAGTLSVLRPDAAFPGDLDREEDWLPLTSLDSGLQVQVVPLPPGLATRAVRISFHQESDKPWQGEIQALHFLQGRFVNVAGTATAFASSFPDGSAKDREAYAPAGLNDGRPGTLHGGQWRNQPGPPLSVEQPAWACLVWEQPQQIAALGLVNAFAKEVIGDRFAGPADQHPATAGADSWQTGETVRVPTPWRPPCSEFLVPLPQGAASRAVRVRFVAGFTKEDSDIAYHTKGEPIHARLGELVALHDLGDRPLESFLASQPGPRAARETENRGQQAVPTPGTVTVDGQLADWDRTAGIYLCPDTLLLRGRASAWCYAMYDAEALYVAIDVDDPTPLRNQHDPDSEPSLGWGGDCLQLRVRTDRVTHLTTWHSAAKGKSVIHVAYGANFDGGEIPNAMATGQAQVAFQPRPDGSGYVEELRLPWSLLVNGQPPQAGSELHLAYDLRWGEKGHPEFVYGDNVATVGVSHENLWRSPDTWGPLTLSARGWLPFADQPWLRPEERVEAQGPVAIRYTLPPAADAQRQVTLVVEDATGHRVRNLLSHVPRSVGEHTEHWDGLDDLGTPVPPGDYQWRLLDHAPFHLRYKLTVNHSGNPPWLSGQTGGWLSDHAPPSALCAIGQQVFVGADIAESGHTILAADLDGRKLWGTKWLNLAGAGELASDGKQVYVGSEGGWIKAKLQVNVVDPTTYAFHNILEEDFGDGKNLPGLSGIAVAGDHVYLALSKLNVVRVYTLPTTPDGKATKLGEFPVTNPRGLGTDPEGRVWICTGQGIWRTTGATGPAEAVFAEGLANPRGLCFDGDGNLLVADGAPSHQVKIFTPAGKLLRTIGTPGGRGVGPYDPQQMDQPEAVAVDATGQIWVAEHSWCPKRTSIWSPDGKLVKAQHGPTRYGGSGYLDAVDRTRLYDDGVTYRIDWDARTWVPEFVHYRKDAQPGMSFLRTPGRSWRFGDRIFHANYDYWTSRYLVLYERLADGRIVPLAAAGQAGYAEGHTITGVALWSEDRFAERRGGRDPKELNFVWSDLNRDGDQQPEEVFFFPTPFADRPHCSWEALWSMWIAPDGTFVLPGRDTGNRQAIWALSPVRWQENGAPVYDPAALRLAADIPKRAQVAVYKDIVQSVVAGRDGKVVSIADPITGCDAGGKPVWTFENPWPGVHGSHRAPAWTPGTVVGGLLAIGTGELDGSLGELFAFTGNKGQVYLFTTDGLFVASLFQDHRVGDSWNMPEAKPDLLLDSVSLGEEHFGGHFTRSSDGRYYLVVGHNHASVVEVENVSTIRRQEGKVALTPELAQVCDALARDRAAQLAAKEAPRVYRLGRLPQPPKADGSLAEWSAVPTMAWQASGGKAEVRLGYDATSLYLAYQIEDRSPAVNHGDDWRLRFKTGDAVDLQLGTDPKADAKRRNPVPGDLRLLLVPKLQYGKGTVRAILYRHRVPGAPAEGKTTFSSPWRSEVVDEVRELTITAAVRPLPGNRGYTVEAAVPLTELTLVPSSGLNLRGDVGVLFGDAAGETTVERSYWSNRTCLFTSDVPGEIMLYPNLWGTFEFE